MGFKDKIQTLKFNFSRACVAATCKFMGGDPGAPGVGTILGTAFRQLLSQADPQPALVPIPVHDQHQNISSGPHSRYG